MKEFIIWICLVRSDLLRDPEQIDRSIALLLCMWKRIRPRLAAVLRLRCLSIYVGVCWSMRDCLLIYWFWREREIDETITKDDDVKSRYNIFQRLRNHKLVSTKDQSWAETDPKHVKKHRFSQLSESCTVVNAAIMGNYICDTIKRCSCMQMIEFRIRWI
jgi:hypothetical protein